MIIQIICAVIVLYLFFIVIRGIIRFIKNIAGDISLWNHSRNSKPYQFHMTPDELAEIDEKLYREQEIAEQRELDRIFENAIHPEERLKEIENRMAKLDLSNPKDYVEYQDLYQERKRYQQYKNN